MKFNPYDDFYSGEILEILTCGDGCTAPTGCHQRCPLLLAYPTGDMRVLDGRIVSPEAGWV